MSIKSERKKKIKQEKQAAQAAAMPPHVAEAHRVAAEASKQEAAEHWDKIDRESKTEYTSVAEAIESGAEPVFYNDGDVALAWCRPGFDKDGEETMPFTWYTRAKAAAASAPRLTRAMFRVFFPVNESIKRLTADCEFVETLRKMVYSEEGLPLPEKTPAMIPHYTNEKVLQLFKDGDPRITTNFYGTGKALELSQDPGYFTYGEDEHGNGIVIFKVTNYETAEVTTIFTAAVELTDKIRNAKCSAPDCKCNAPWTELIHGCECKRHHEGRNEDVLPRFELCSPTECDGKHVHLVGMCEVCFYEEVMEGKKLADVAADNFQHQLYNNEEPEPALVN